jgi:hypothetical protein
MVGRKKTLSETIKRDTSVFSNSTSHGHMIVFQLASRVLLLSRVGVISRGITLCQRHIVIVSVYLVRRHIVSILSISITIT